MGQSSFHDQLSKAAANFSFLMKSTAPSHPRRKETFSISLSIFYSFVVNENRTVFKINNPSPPSHPFIEGSKLMHNPEKYSFRNYENE